MRKIKNIPEWLEKKERMLEAKIKKIEKSTRKELEESHKSSLCIAKALFRIVKDDNREYFLVERVKGNDPSIIDLKKKDWFLAEEHEDYYYFRRRIK